MIKTLKYVGYLLGLPYYMIMSAWLWMLDMKDKRSDLEDRRKENERTLSKNADIKTRKTK